MRVLVSKSIASKRNADSDLGLELKRVLVNETATSFGVFQVLALRDELSEREKRGLRLLSREFSALITELLNKDHEWFARVIGELSPETYERIMASDQMIAWLESGGNVNE